MPGERPERDEGAGAVLVAERRAGASASVPWAGLVDVEADAVDEDGSVRPWRYDTAQLSYAWSQCMHAL